MRLHQDYRPPLIHITESGAAFADDPSAPGQFRDVRRVEYLRSHFEAAQRAIADGVPLRGYFVWSLMDNFEWGEGMSKRFGLYHVDPATQHRTPRESAFWFREWILQGAAGVPDRQSNTRRPS